MASSPSADLSAVGRSLRLSGQEPIGSIPPENVYFAFSSGRFHYDCAACGAKCCRGHGYQLHADDISYQVGHRHALTLFLDKSKGLFSPFSVQNLAPSCFFLSEGGRCEVQSEFGMAAKPEPCRLFPFNDIRRAGGHLVVAPHVGLCPLEIDPTGTSACSDHQVLYESMAAFGLRSPVPEAIPVNGDVGATLNLELKIRSICELLVDAARYAECVVEQLRLVNPGLPESVARARVTHFERTLSAVLGTVPSEEALRNVSLVRTMIALTPVLRSHLVFVTRQREQQQPLVPPDRVPYLLIVLYIFAAHAVDAGMKRVTYETLTSLFSKSQALLAMLSYVDLKPHWRTSAGIVWPLGHDREFEAGYLAVVKALLNQRSHETLGSLLVANAPASALSRIVFLKLVARSLHGRISTASHESLTRAWYPRRSLQRIAVRYLSPKVLETLEMRRRHGSLA